MWEKYVCRCFISLYFIIFPLKPVCFLTRDKMGVNPNERGSGKELGGLLEGVETVIEIYNKTIFN